MSNSPYRPSWLTDALIEGLKRDIATCPNPYTDADIENMVFDGDYDLKRKNAHTALEILTKYNIPFDDIKQI